MRKMRDLTGNVYGRLLVIGFGHFVYYKSGKRCAFWSCECECGNIVTVRGNNLTRGVSKSCGCVSPFRAKHLACFTKEYRAWGKMLHRCRNANSPSYHNYGQRGISVDERWHSFEEFMKDMGKCPPDAVDLDRIDNSLGYGPENCRWTSRATNVRNTRLSRWWWINGNRYESISDAAVALGVDKNRIRKMCGRTGKASPGCYSELKYPSQEVVNDSDHQ